MATIYLIPTSLGDTGFNPILPSYNTEIVTALRYFIVEDLRTARRFLKKSNPSIDIDALTFFILNQHTTPEELSGFLQPMFEGNDMGVLSEAGCPAIADPGADVVAMAQKNSFKVVPL